MAYRQNSQNIYEDIMSRLTGSNFLGPITRAVPRRSDRDLIIGYSIKAKNLVVMGTLPSGQGEIAGWENIENDKGIMTLVYLASKWDELHRRAMSEYGTMAILLHKEANFGQDDICVENSAQAKQFVEKWTRWYQNLNQ